MTDGTEFRFFIGTHATVLATTPDTFFQIAATLNESGLSFLDQMLPLDESRSLR